MKDQGCPPRETLRDFVVGKLASADLAEIAGHVGACQDCESILRGLDASCDAFVEQLRDLPSRRSGAVGEVAADLIEAARAAYRSGFGESPKEFVSDPGSKMAGLLADGPVRLGRFELLSELGVGSFGYVFRAHDSELDRDVAIKIQRSSNLSNRQAKDRFLREARRAAQLDHPNIVSCFEVSETDDGVNYLVTELIEGQTLQHELGRTRFESKQTAGLVADLAEALHYAHVCGVIHRDIKPSNIIIDGAGRPYIMDFGLAKREAGEVTVTAEGEVMGTPAYMSPEQARGDSHTVDPRSDIYSLGVVLYEMLSGEKPFPGNRRMVLLQVLEDEPRPPGQLCENIPRDLETICLKAMAKSPAKRYDTAEAMALDLRRFVAGEPIHARQQGRVERLIQWCRRNQLAAGLFVTVTLGSLYGLIHLSVVSTLLVHKTAEDSARMQSEMFEDVNDLYSEIIGRLDPEDVEITHEYEYKSGALPLPATFTIEAGQRISCRKSGMKVRLYSDYPFPWRSDGGPRDEFERRALKLLREDPTRHVQEYTESGGHLVLRYATARIMKASCLGCHNTRPDSPKTDWKVGDVRGVLEIIRPLERDTMRIREALRGTLIRMGIIASVLLGMTLSIIVIGDRRRRSVLPSSPRPIDDPDDAT